jgi:hypothetical protein
MPDQTAKLMLSFINRIRIAAAHDPACEPDQNPLQRAYEVCVSKLSDEERSELVRIINKLSQQLDAHWRVEYLDKHNSSHLGTIEAADEDGAIDQAAKQFNITPARRNKIVVTRIQAAENHAPDSSD